MELDEVSRESSLPLPQKSGGPESFGPKLRKNVREAVPLAALTLPTMYVETMAIEMWC